MTRDLGTDNSCQFSNWMSSSQFQCHRDVNRPGESGVLDLVAAGRPVAQIAADLAISDHTIYAWRKQELIDTGQVPGLSRTEQSELSAAKKRIRELENEVAILKRSRELLREPHDPKGDTRP
jgi:transposase